MGGSEVSTSVVKWSVVGQSLNERKRSVDKCSEEKRSEVQMGKAQMGSEVSTSVVKWSEGLDNRVSYHY